MRISDWSSDVCSSDLPPTPKEAYLWGLKNITGLRTPPLAEGDYRRLLLGIDDASIAKGVIRYCSRLYYPVNEPAQELAFRSAARPKRVEEIGGATCREGG